MRLVWIRTRQDNIACCWRQLKSSKSRRRRRRLKGIHSRPDTNRTGAEGLSFYYPRLLHYLDQMLAVMSLSQHRVSSSKTVRPRALCGARCIGHAVSTWSAVCSEAPHSQFGDGARPHLCMDEWNRPTPVRRRLSLTEKLKAGTTFCLWFLHLKHPVADLNAGWVVQWKQCTTSVTAVHRSAARTYWRWFRYAEHIIESANTDRVKSS